MPMYDRAVSAFSPEGRILQVEYALVMVNNSPTAVGIATNEGVILGGIERRQDALQDKTFSHKIFKIDDHAGAVVAGFSSDARVLIDLARNEAQINRLYYDEPVDIEYLVRRLSEVMQSYTQHAGFRPFGVSLVIGGVDLIGPNLYQIDPSGIYTKYFATAAGIGRSVAMDKLKERYDKSMSLSETKRLVVEALKVANKEEAVVENVKLAEIKTDDRLFKMLSDAEVAEIFKLIPS
jgi:proteasome alpha subunit